MAAQPRVSQPKQNTSPAQTVWGFVHKVSKGMSQKGDDFHRLDVDTPKGTFKMICFDEATVDTLDALQDDALLLLTTKNTSRVYDATVVSARMPTSAEVAGLTEDQRAGLSTLLAQGLLRQDSAGVLRFGLTIQGILGENSDRLSKLAVDGLVRRIGDTTPDVAAIAEDIGELDPTLKQGRLLAQLGLRAKPEERFEAKSDAIAQAIQQAKAVCADTTGTVATTVTALEGIQRTTRDDNVHFGVYIDAIALAQKANTERALAPSTPMEQADRGVDFARKSKDFHLTTVANTQVGQTAAQQAAALKGIVAGTHQITTTTLPLIERQFQTKLTQARAHALDPQSALPTLEPHTPRGTSIEARSLAHHYTDPQQAKDFMALSLVLEKAQHVAPDRAVFATDKGAILLAATNVGLVLVHATYNAAPKTNRYATTAQAVDSLSAHDLVAGTPGAGFLLGYAAAVGHLEPTKAHHTAQKAAVLVQAMGWAATQGPGVSQAVEHMLERTTPDKVHLAAAGAATGLLEVMVAREHDRESKTTLAAAGLLLHTDLLAEQGKDSARTASSTRAVLGVAEGLGRGQSQVSALARTIERAIPAQRFDEGRAAGTTTPPLPKQDRER